MRLRDKVAIITGAGSGMGEATAIRFAEEGARLVLNDLRPELLDALVERLDGSSCVAVPGDVSSEETAQALAEVASRAYQGADILVNNAGIFLARDITDVTLEQWNKLLAVNVTSMILCCKHVLPLMLARGSGSIVNFSSTSAYVGQEFEGRSTFEYNMTKAAAKQLTTSLATRYAADGIRVNSVCPGLIRTNLLVHMDPERYSATEDMSEKYADYVAATPLGRAADPSEVAAAVLFLASDDASFITGAHLVVDGGYLAR